MFPNEPYPRAGLVSEARRRTRREPSLTAPNVEETTSGRPGPGAKGPAARGPRPVPAAAGSGPPAAAGPSTPAAGKTHVVYERRQLEDVNSAIREVETGQVKARLVFDLQ